MVAKFRYVLNWCVIWCAIYLFNGSAVSSLFATVLLSIAYTMLYCHNSRIQEAIVLHHDWIDAILIVVSTYDIITIILRSTGGTTMKALAVIALLVFVSGIIAIIMAYWYDQHHHLR